jgi:hypothetical protein
VSGRLHALYADVVAELLSDPTASANQIDARLRAARKRYWRNDVLAAVRNLRSLPTTPESARGPGRSQNGSVPFVQPRGEVKP